MAKPTAKKPRPKKLLLKNKAQTDAAPPIVGQTLDFEAALDVIHGAIARRDLSDSAILDLMLRCGVSLAARRLPTDAVLHTFAETPICYQTTDGETYVSFYRGSFKVGDMPNMTEGEAKDAGYSECGR